MWAVCLERHDGRVQLATPDLEVKEDTFKNRIHVVPCSLDGEYWEFGVHRFTTVCPCNPKIERRDGWTIFHHTERVN